MNTIFKNIESINSDLDNLRKSLPNNSLTKSYIEDAIINISNSSEKLIDLSIPISPTEQKEINAIINRTKSSIEARPRQEKQILTNANQLASYLSSKIQGRN